MHASVLSRGSDALSTSPHPLHSQANLCPTNHPPPPKPLLTFDPITENKLLEEIKRINIYKSSGLPDVNTRLLKDAMLCMTREFLLMFNLSLSSSTVPQDWKIATVIPIPKVKNSKSVSDLRPISLLPIPGKLLEHIIHDRLMTHLEMNKLISRRQFGFRPGLSMIDAISTLIDDVGLSINNNDLTIATFIDFKKAFDTLDHQLIINRLTELNLHDSIILWFKSYLSNRQQTTLINNIRSTNQPISTGVPQGSILGPLLFIIYVDKLTHIPKNSSILMYADDTVIYTPINKKLNNHTIVNFQADLNRVSAWCYLNRLSINTSKTQVMILGSSKRHTSHPQPPTLTMNGSPLTNTTKYKYLGLTLTPNLTFEDHTRKAIGLVTSKINSLSYLRKYVGSCTALQIYKTTILPLMEYSNFIYPLVPITLRKKLQRLQNRALKIIFKNIDNLSLPELHNNAKLTSVEQRASRQLTCLMYKRSHNPSDYPLLTTARHTRQNEKIRFDLPKPNSEKFKRFPLYVGSKLWDLLDHSTQRTPEYFHFKAKLPKTPDFNSYPVS